MKGEGMVGIHRVQPVSVYWCNDVHQCPALLRILLHCSSSQLRWTQPHDMALTYNLMWTGCHNVALLYLLCSWDECSHNMALPYLPWSVKSSSQSDFPLGPHDPMNGSLRSLMIGYHSVRNWITIWSFNEDHSNFRVTTFSSLKWNDFQLGILCILSVNDYLKIFSELWSGEHSTTGPARPL